MMVFMEIPKIIIAALKIIMALILLFFLIIGVFILFSNITFLNTNNGALNVVFSGVVAISTVIYAYLTHSLVSETKKLRKYQIEPEIIITMEPKEGYMQYIFSYSEHWRWSSN
jgi:membrane protein implicated in regulation of membrane protease activity